MTRKILCVDDKESITTFFAHVLSAMGHTVSVASDGEEAIAHATAMQFDVVITDHQMPQMTGLELVRHLRATAYPGKIIVYTGALPPGIMKEYEALKVDAIAMKPMGITEILALLKKP